MLPHSWKQPYGRGQYFGRKGKKQVKRAIFSQVA